MEAHLVSKAHTSGVNIIEPGVVEEVAEEAAEDSE